MNNPKNNKNSIIAFGIITLFLVLSIISFIGLKHDDTNARYRDRYIKFDEGWTLVTSEGESDAVLPVKVTTKYKEAVTLKIALPDTIAFDTGLMTRNYHQILEAKLDGEVIFAYPNRGWNRLGNIISDEWLLIDIRQDYAGKTLEISFTNSTFFPFTAYIGDFYYGNVNSVVQHVRSITSLGFGMGVNMCIIGVILLIISFLYRKYTNQAQNTAMGAALLFFGMWLTNRSKMPHFSTESSAPYFIALMALMLVAPCIFTYSYCRSDEHKKYSLLGARACIAADLILLVSSLVIPYSVEILAMAAYFMSCVALVWNGYLLFSGSYGKASKTHNKKEILLDKTEFYSNMLFPVATIFEVILYHNMLWTDASIYFRTGALIYTWIYMAFVLWRTFMVVQDRTLVTQRLQESQMELMMGQIQPHFIFNTLSSIRTLVMVDPSLAYDMIYDFSNYLRANVDNVTNLEGIPFASEVRHIKSYVNIERVRFGDRLDVEYDIQNDTFTVPPLSIQPLVENAIKHGVCQKPAGGTVWLRSYEDDKYNIIEVEDNGIGFSPENASRVFSVQMNEGDDVHIASNKVMLAALEDVLNNATLLDKDGNPIVLTQAVQKVNLSGNGSEEHKSTGMMNIFMRLKEMGHAKAEIYSKEGEGTKIRVLFPKTV